MTGRMISAVQIAVAVLVSIGPASVAHSQEPINVKYNSGQTAQPAFEGWTRNPDGSYSMWFGYLNRNYKETPDIPPGPNNGFGSGGEDLGQPTHFLHRRQKFAFQVKVPADWPKDKDMVWTVNVNGQALKAYGSLWPVWEIDDKIMSANNGGRTARLFGEPPNVAPRITVALPAQTIAVGAPLSLTLSVSDDGMPKIPARLGGGGAANAPAGGRGGPASGPGATATATFDPTAEAIGRVLRVKWIHYRGAGTAKFMPQVAVVIGADGKPVPYPPEGPAMVVEGKATTNVTFDKPGTYTLRAYAMDPDAFMDIKDVNVTVAAPEQTQR